MKNIFRFLMAVAVLFTASCAKEEISTSIAGGEIEVSFTANLADLGTRATYGTGNKVNTLRYKVFSNGELLNDLCGTIEANDGTKFYSVNLVLIKGMSYDILFWADHDAQYAISNEGVVSFSTDGLNANDETRDAFYYLTEDFDPANANSENTTITLRRPFAQLNAIVPNMTEVGKSMDLDAPGAYIKSTIATTICRSFNPFTGEAGDETPAVVTFGETNVQDFAEGHLSMNYLLAPGHLVDVTFFFEGEKFATNTTINNIPLKANYKTNVIGNLLTGSTEFNVSIDANWAPQEEYILDGGEVELTENIVAKKVVVKKNTVLKLNGKKIVGGQPDSAEMTGTDIAAITVENGATLTIEGEGTIEGTEYGVYAKNGNVVIKGGNISAGTSAVQVYKGTVNIEGGQFSATKSNVYVINCIDSAYNSGEAVVNITGGTFVDFNPADNAAEGTGTNFVAPGYSSVQNGNEYEVINGVFVSSKDELNNAFTLDYVSCVRFASNIDMGTASITPTRDLTIDMHGNTYTAYSGVGNYSFSVRNGNALTINNANMISEGFSVMFGGKVTFNNGNVIFKSSKNSRNLFYVASDEAETIVTINEGNFSIDLVHQKRTSYVAAVGNAIVYINGGNFGDPAPEAAYKPISTSSYNGYTGKVIISGGTFKFNPLAHGATLAEGCQCIENNGVWTVSKQ